MQGLWGRQHGRLLNTHLSSTHTLCANQAQQRAVLVTSSVCKPTACKALPPPAHLLEKRHLPDPSRPFRPPPPCTSILPQQPKPLLPLPALQIPMAFLFPLNGQNGPNSSWLRKHFPSAQLTTLQLCPLRQAPRPPWTLGTAAHGPTQPQVSTPLPSHAKAHPDGRPPREPGDQPRGRPLLTARDPPLAQGCSRHEGSSSTDTSASTDSALPRGAPERSRDSPWAAVTKALFNKQA